MRIVVGVLGVLLSLPFVLIGLFQRNFPQSQQRVVELMRIASGTCCLGAAGSVFVPSWGRAGAVVLALVGAVYAVMLVGHWFTRRSVKRDTTRGGR